MGYPIFRRDGTEGIKGRGMADMRVLLAAPDRDLLQCYQKILEEPYGNVVAAFDGTQVLELLAEGDFDAAVLDRELPRIGHRTILELLRRENIPVIVLQDSPVTSSLLLGEPLANAYLPNPFLPGELLSLLQNVLEKAASPESVWLAGQELRLSAFQLPSGKSITAGELDTLLALLAGKALDIGETGVYISALNHKFAKHFRKAGISYLAGEGFKLVTENE